MAEISRVDLLEIGRNASDDELTLRSLNYRGDNASTTNSGQDQLQLEANWNPDDAGKKIEMKHPTDLTLFEIRTILSTSGDTATVNSNFTNTYPSGSTVYIVEGEKDMFDSAVSDRVETNVEFFERQFKEAD